MASKKDNGKETVPQVGDVLWAKSNGADRFLRPYVVSWQRRYVVLANQQYIYVSSKKGFDGFSPERVKRSCLSLPKSDWRGGNAPAGWARSWADACAQERLEGLRDDLRLTLMAKVSTMDEVAIQKLASTLGITLEAKPSEPPPEPPET